jgi:hypothetical protein
MSAERTSVRLTSDFVRGAVWVAPYGVGCKTFVPWPEAVHGIGVLVCCYP